MKKYLIALIACLTAYTAFGQKMYNGLPLLEMNSTSADCKVGNELYKDIWKFSPRKNTVSLPLALFGESEKFVFYTGIDSIALTLSPDQAQQFYIKHDPGIVHFNGRKISKNAFEI